MAELASGAFGASGTSMLVVAFVVMAVLWVSKGALAVVAGLPLLSQILQVLGLLYVAEMVMEASGRPVQRLQSPWTLPPTLARLVVPAPTTAPVQK